MSDLAGRTERGKEGFRSASARWDVAKFGGWLRTGLDLWFHQGATPGSRAVAFRPLILDPDRDPIAPLVDAVETIPGGLERLRDAGSEALAVWTAESKHSGDVLDALLRLAKRLPAPGHIAALRRLFFEGFLDEQPQNEPQALQALESALALLGLQEGEALLRDLRNSPRWRPAFAATWLEGMTRAGKLDWFEGLCDLSEDLAIVAPTGRELHPLLRRLLHRVGDAVEVAERFATFDLDDEWMVEALFTGERPPIRLVYGRDAINKNAPILILWIGEAFADVDSGSPSGKMLYAIHQTYLSRRPPRERPPRKPKDDTEGYLEAVSRRVKEMLGRLSGDSSPGSLAPATGR